MFFFFIIILLEIDDGDWKTGNQSREISEKMRQQTEMVH